MREFVELQPVQTNEVGRCWTLLPAFLLAVRADPRPIDLVELGPSGGLNLCWPSYRYDYGGVEWGPVSLLRLSGRWERAFPSPLFDVVPDVRRRVGIDRTPVDVVSDEGSLLLQAFVWADEPERIERMRAAIDVFRRDPPELVRGDYVELLPERLAESDPTRLTVVFHSASTQYVDAKAFAELERAIEDAGARLPLAWISMEPSRSAPLSGFELRLRQWPGGEPRLLAKVHYHGRWIEWLAS